LKRLLGAFVLLTFATFWLGAEPQAEPARGVVKADSKVEFHANATFAKVIGVFHSWDVNLKMPSDKFDAASIDMQIEADSVATGSGIRDKEVKGKNFFDVKQYPEIRFVSKSITHHARDHPAGVCCCSRTPAGKRSPGNRWRLFLQPARFRNDAQRAV
jgi:polyisoprenoid-binding protein YceI